MSEIERKSGLLDDITTTTATVAAVISSALETAAATDEDSSIQENHEQTRNSSVSFSHNNTASVPQEAEESSSLINQEEQFVGNNNNNKLFSLEDHHQKEQVEEDYLGRRKGDESLVSGDDEEDVEANKCSSRTRPFHHHPPKGDLNVAGRAEEGRNTDCDHHSSKPGNADGNHVRELHEISSLSPFLSMAEKAGDYYCVSNSSSISSSSGRLIRDKSDNRETYPVSHCEEKSTDEYERSQDKTIKTDTKSSSYQQQQTDSYQSSRVFKPSSKIIELPEKAPRLHDHSHHYHHHGHHHYRSKESKIPVGIAVAWQRLVTSTSTNPTVASAMTTKAESGSSSLPSPSSSPSSPRHSKSHVMNNSNSQQNKQVESSSTKHPSRPSSASPLSSKTKINSSGGSGSGRHHHHHHHLNHSSSISSSNSNNPIYASRNNSGDNNTSLNNAGGSSNINSANKNGYLGALVGGGGGESSDISVGSSVNSNNNSNVIGRPLSACGEASGGGGIVPFCPSAASPLSRPLPSSSVPPNLGFPTASSYQYPHRGPYIDYPYSNSGSGGFAMPSSPHHHHHQQQHHNHPALVGNSHYWGLENPSVPLLSPGMPSPGASEYLQLSMQQQMQLHQQHLIATSRQSSLPLSSSSPYNPYLPFLYPHQDASLAAKNPYYDHFFHQNELIRHHHQQQSQILLNQQHQQQQHEAFQQHQQQQQQQQLHHHSHQNETGNSRSNSSGISSSVNGSNNNGSSGRTSSTNSNVSVSNVGGFDLLANNGSQPHRAIPMQVASSRTSIPLLSLSPTGGIRTSTPTSTSSSSSSSTTVAATTTATVVTSCNTSITPHHDQSSSQSASASWPAASSQATGGVELSNSYSSSYSSASSPSPSFLLLHHQQQHPHLFTSSSAALSPKSLTSSTPSPVTVHDFNSGLNVVIGNSSNGSGEKSNNLSSASTMLAARKCATPSPISLTPRGLLSPFGSPFSPSPVPTHPANNNNNSSVKDLVRKEGDAKIKPIPTKAHAGGGAGNVDELRTIMVNGNSSSLTTTPTSSPLLKRKQINVPTPLSSPSQKHDFKRLESLIERRDSESISPLVLIPQHSPASTTSSIGDKGMSIDELSGHHHHHRHTSLSSSISHPDVGESSPHHLDDDDDDDVDLHAERKIIPAFHVKLEKEGEEESGMKAMPSNTMRLDLHIPKVSGIGSGGGSGALSSESAITTAPATSAFELLKPTESSSSSAPATNAEKQGLGSKGDTNANNKSSSISCSEDLFKVKSNHPAESLHEMKLEKAAGESSDASAKILVKVESSVHSSISSCDVKFHSGENKVEKVDADAGENEHGVDGGISIPPANIISSAGDHNEIERINVPESTLPFNDNYGSRNISSTSFKEKQQSIEDNIEDHHQQQQAQPSRVKDVSFTSGYSSSHDTSLPFVEDVVDHDPFKHVTSSEATPKNVKSGKDKKKKPQAKDKGKTSKPKPASLPIKYKKSGSIKPKTERKEKKGKQGDSKTTSEFGMKKEKRSKAATKVEKEPPKSKSTKKKLKDKVGQPVPLSCGETLAVWKSVGDEPPTKKRKKEKDKQSGSAPLELQKIVGNDHDINNIDKNPKKKKNDKAIITSKVKKDSDKSPSRKKKVLSDKTVIDEGDTKKKTKKERKIKGKDGEKIKKPSKKVSRSPPPYRRKSSDDQQKKKSRRKSHSDEMQKWPPVLNQSNSNPVTNNNYQFVNTTDNPNSPPFTQTATGNIVTSNYGANSGDINTSFSCSNSLGLPPQQGTATGAAMHYQSINLGDCGDQTKTSSLINSTTNPSLITQQQQPVALVLHPNNYQTAPVSSCPTSQVNPSSVSCQPQVTFLIAASAPMPLSSSSAPPNPTPVVSENTLRIPAYIPRVTSASSSVVDSTSFVQSTNFSLTDELGGESYGGPSTLTLHRDVDSGHHHQSYIQPPAITIQYHHSAPATPAGTLEASSPPYGIKPEENHLNLLATVAQEFGSREDLGKRLSIDGSCNNSIIGESPPMSPQKSPYSIIQYHHPLPISINGNSMISSCSTTANANSNAAVKVDGNWKHVGDNGGGIVEHHHHINNNSSGLSVKEVGVEGDGNKDSLLQKVQTKPEKQQKAKPVKKPKVKTANSITQPKAGKKQKRSVSDSASYSPPVVLLKIPQVATKQRISTIQEEKARKQSKQTKALHTKPIAPKLALNTVDNGKALDGEKPVVVKGEKKKRSKKDKLSKPLTKANDEKLGKLQKKSVGKPEKKAKVPKSKLEKKISSSASTTSKSSPTRKPLLSPLKLQMPTTTSDHVTLTATITTTSTTSTTSPVKEKVSKSPGASSCFYNPPERISAFAKQAIARRDSTSATSPTKQPLSSSGSSSNESPFKYSMLFPNLTKTTTATTQSANNINPTVEHQSQQLLSGLKMPPLSSFDLPQISNEQLAPVKLKEASFPVPKVDKVQIKFPTSTAIRPSSSSPSSVSELKGLVREPTHPIEQDKKKTELLLDRSPTSSYGNTTTSPTSNGKPNGQVKKEMREERKKKEKKAKKLPKPLKLSLVKVVGVNDGDDIVDDNQLRKGKKRKRREISTDGELVPKKPRKKRAARSKSFSSAPGQTLVSNITPSYSTPPTITITPSSATPTAAPSSQFSLTSSSAVVTGSINRQFSPLTPPLTAKSSLGEEDDREKRSFPSSIASCSASSTGSSRHSSPSRLGEAETENENENDFSNWVADPMFAVSAIKITSSNQPSDISSNGGDDSSVNLDVESVGEERTPKERKKGSSNKPPKLTLMSVSNNNKPESNHNMVMSNAHPSDKFHEAQSQLKSLHFKPKQLSSGKSQKSSRHHHIKPSLKAEPVLRSQTEDEEDDERAGKSDDDNDDDFELDMEVANITTQNTPKTHKQRKASGGSASVSSVCNSSGKRDGGAGSVSSTTEAATSSASAGKKPSINRNSLSYLSNSSSKQHSHPSTKEIMTKVFSRKVSPELRRERDGSNSGLLALSSARGKERKQRHPSKKLSKSSSSNTLYSQQGTEMDADDEDEDELLDIDDLPIAPVKQATVSMSAAAAAVIVNNTANATTSFTSSEAATTTISSSTTSLPPSKKLSPKKRSARSSTTSSSASVSTEKVQSRSSSSRGNRGQLSFFPTSTTTTNQSGEGSQQEKDETLCPGKVELGSVDELVDEMRILTEIQGLFYTGRLNALQPPDVYGVTLDNERGAPPHLIFSAEEVLEKCLREKKPQTLSSGLRICAYWSPQYSGLYPGRVSSDFTPKFDPEKDLIPIEFDDGDTGMIKLKEIRLLSTNHPVREYDPNPLLTLEKKQRKRRHSSATGTSGGCTGDHDEPDCGEPYCAKVGKMDGEEDEEEDDDDGGLPIAHHSSSKMLYWTWSGLGYKRPKCKKSRNKEFFHGIQRGNEAINVGDAALFISTGNERPFIGRVERFWEQKGKKMVNVRWFYHPEEVKASAKRLSNLKYPGALFESPHIDENDVQTIAKKCDVLPFPEFKKRLSPTSGGSPRLAKLTSKTSTKPRDMYYVAGFYDPYTYNLTLKDLK